MAQCISGSKSGKTFITRYCWSSYQTGVPWQLRCWPKQWVVGMETHQRSTSLLYEWKHDWFCLLRCNHLSSVVLCAHSLLLSCACVQSVSRWNNRCGFVWGFFSLEAAKHLRAWVLTSYVLVAALFALVQPSLEICAKSPLTKKQIKNNNKKIIKSSNLLNGVSVDLE